MQHGDDGSVSDVWTFPAPAICGQSPAEWAPVLRQWADGVLARIDDRQRHGHACAVVLRWSVEHRRVAREVMGWYPGVRWLGEELMGKKPDGTWDDDTLCIEARGSFNRQRLGGVG